MWIPRFAINDETNDVKYIKDTEKAEDGFTIPDIFMYKQDSETMPDFLLTGVYVGVAALGDPINTITQMNSEESIYGFIANTKAMQINADDISSLQAFVGNDAHVVPLNDITNPNRIILKIINDKNQDPIKAKGTYDKETGLITVEVTYSQYGINEILLQNTTELTFIKESGIIKADTTEIDLEDGDNVISVIDNKGNRKELTVKVISKIYATLYTDGTLALGKSENPIPEKTISVKFGDITRFTSGSAWMSYRDNIKVVAFVDKISPYTTESWFTGCQYLTTINKINNLDTSNVTDMSNMFYYCTSLNELDLTNFDTSNVTKMNNMLSFCTSLKKLDLSSFDTSKVTEMMNMFFVSRNLIEIDVSSFDTSNVTIMANMFNNCNNLSKIDVSNFDTSNVKNMNGMFTECNNLSELDLSSFDVSKVTDFNYMFSNCTNLKTIYVNSSTDMWPNSIQNSTSSKSPYRNMFTGCGTSTVTRK